MLSSEYSVAITSSTNRQLLEHLIRTDNNEDVCFALWTPSYGNKRLTALVHTIILPKKGDRQIHGNASFNPQYYERVCQLAIEKKCGIAFLHSHPVPGWQYMSHDDVIAEQKLMKSTNALTDLPLLGMTTGSDGTWSARFWANQKGNSYKGIWCKSVRVIDKTIKTDFCDQIIPIPDKSEMIKRTITVWGEKNYDQLSRLKIGIVGLGSVGGLVALSLARMGLTNLVFIDFDEIQEHNLDRLDFAIKSDIGKLKIDVAKERAIEIATASQLNIATVPYSVVEEPGYKAALDCDVLFSCVDRPRPRSILNHFAYSHLIPVIDGGIDVRFKNGIFSGADWQLQTVGPGRPCLNCLGVYTWDDVSTETEGKLDEPSYFSGLPDNHRFLRNENVFPFSQNLASLEVMQFIALTTGCGGFDDFGVQRFRYNPGILESKTEKSCNPSCSTKELIATGDSHFSLSGKDHSAIKARNRQQE